MSDDKKGSLKHAEAELHKEKLYYPSRDGEGFLWNLFLEFEELTLEEVEKHRSETPAMVGGEEYVKTCFDFMIKAGVICEGETDTGETTYHVSPELLKAHREREEEIANRPIYYCEQCFHVRGEIVELSDGVLEDAEDADPGRLACPKCQGEWKLNRGYARHVVSLKLQHYRKLAEKLGILEIEEESDPV